MQSTVNQVALEAMKDEELMLAYCEGTASAFDALYARHKGGLYRYFLRQLNHQPELANELFQEVWMKLIRTRQSYQPTASFTTFLYRLAYHRLVDHYRSTGAQLPGDSLDESMPADHQTPVEQLQHEQLRQQVKQAIAQLPSDQRNTFLLKEEGALSLADIAEVTGVNRETVKSRLRYAMKHLRQALSPMRSMT